VHELLLGVIAGVDLRERAQLGVRPEDQVGPAAGPLDLAGGGVAALERVPSPDNTVSDVATQERAVRGADGRDWTQSMITGSVCESGPLRKRQAILAMVTTPRAADVPAREIAKAIPPSRFLPVDGSLAGAELREASALAYPKGDPGRWFVESPIHDEGRTWIVTKMWGRNAEPTS
jgi:hypothetical protein